MTEEKFYVGVPEPEEVRKYMLESSKAMIMTLKKYEAFKKKRMEKVELITRFNQLMKQINILNNRLKKEFPEAGIRVPVLRREAEVKKEAPQKIVGQKQAVQKAAPQRQQPAQKTELQRLEEELALIERKLNAL